MASFCHHAALLGVQPMLNRHILWGASPRLAVTLSMAATLVIAPLFSPAVSATPSNTRTTALRPFEAIYKTNALGMTLDLTRSLTRDGDTYRLTSRGENFLIKMNESADFRLTNSGIEGIRFTSKVKTLKKSKRAVEFDTELGIIRSFKRDEWSEHEMEPGVLDQFSQQQQLRLTLIQSDEPPETLNFRVVDGAKISDKSWQRLPDEILQTPLGDINAVHYRAVHKNPQKRASEIWLAPSLDYLMVKTKHVERSSTIKVDIKSLAWLDEDPIGSGSN